MTRLDFTKGTNLDGKVLFVSGAILFNIATGAQAGQCQDDVAAIDKALKAETLASDMKAQALDIRNQAEQLCTAGNEDEGLALAAEAKVLLQLD